MNTPELTSEGKRGTRGDRWRTGYAVVVQLVLDLLVVLASFYLSFNLRKVAPILHPLGHGFDLYLEVWPLLLLWPLLLWREDLYPGFPYLGGDHLRRIVVACGLAGLLVMAATFVTKTGPAYSRAIIAGGWGLALVGIPLERLALRRLFHRVGITGPRAVVLGAGRTAEVIVKGLQSQKPPSLRPVAAFDDNPAKHGDNVSTIPVLGPIGNADAWAKDRGILAAIVAMPGAGRERLITIIEDQAQSFQRVVVVPDLIGLSTGDTETRDIGGNLAFEVRKNLLYRRNRIAKRAMELAILVVITPVVIPLAVLITLAILFEDGRPAIFTQERVGRGGDVFEAWKFRTMVRNAEQVLEVHLADNPSLRHEWEMNHKLRDDPRLTRVGRLLRRFSLDELPQLLNVVGGTMSLVGPRPIVKDEIPKYGDRFKLYKRVRPGITGLWQVSGRSELDYAVRVQLDTYYVRNWTVWLDLAILARTSWAVLSGRGAY